MRILRGHATAFLAEVQNHVVGSFLPYLQMSGTDGSVGLGEKIHAIQELNHVWASEPHRFLPMVHNFPTHWDRLDCRKEHLCSFFPWLTTSLAFGWWSLRMDPVASDLLPFEMRSSHFKPFLLLPSLYFS